MRAMGKANGVHVVKVFKLDIDSLCCLVCWEQHGSTTCSVIKDMCTPV